MQRAYTDRLFPTVMSARKAPWKAEQFAALELRKKAHPALETNSWNVTPDVERAFPLNHPPLSPPASHKLLGKIWATPTQFNKDVDILINKDIWTSSSAYFN